MIKKIALAVVVTLAACNGYEATSSAVQHDEGTELSIPLLVVGEPVCNSDDTGTVSLTGTLETTGSVDSALVTVQIDGGARQLLDTLAPQEFVDRDGRIKDAAFDVSVTLENGTHTLVLCFTQSGAQGRTEKEVCTAPITVTVDCGDDNECRKTGPFGNIVGNPVLCNSGAPPKIPVHVRGSFGDSASLAISGPNGFTADLFMRHAGNSCVYQLDPPWDTDPAATGNGGAGTYAFHVTGANGETLDFTAELQSCE